MYSMNGSGQTALSSGRLLLISHMASDAPELASQCGSQKSQPLQSRQQPYPCEGRGSWMHGAQ